MFILCSFLTNTQVDSKERGNIINLLYQFLAIYSDGKI